MESLLYRNWTLYCSGSDDDVSDFKEWQSIIFKTSWIFFELRDQFVTKLIKKLKLDENAGAKTAIPVPESEKEKNGAQSQEGDTADDVQDSWEALSDMVRLYY